MDIGYSNEKYKTLNDRFHDSDGFMKKSCARGRTMLPIFSKLSVFTTIVSSAGRCFRPGWLSANSFVFFDDGVTLDLGVRTDVGVGVPLMWRGVGVPRDLRAGEGV